MATNCFLTNDTGSKLGLHTQEGPGKSWVPGSYQIEATRAPAHNETYFLKLNRDDGITEGDPFSMRTSVLDGDHEVICVLEERLVGLSVGSDIWARVRSADGTASTGWVADGGAAIRFNHSGTDYKVSLRWLPTSWYDDLTYRIQAEPAEG